MGLRWNNGAQSAETAKRPTLSAHPGTARTASLKRIGFTGDEPIMIEGESPSSPGETPMSLAP